MLPDPADLSRRLDHLMAWFPTLCRNLGRTVHNVVHPDATPPRKQPVHHSVEEKQLSPTVTLRRTTIDEIEITPASHTTPAPKPDPERRKGPDHPR
jgi:hypothetical protein